MTPSLRPENLKTDSDAHVLSGVEFPKRTVDTISARASETLVAKNSPIEGVEKAVKIVKASLQPLASGHRKVFKVDPQIQGELVKSLNGRVISGAIPGDYKVIRVELLNNNRCAFYTNDALIDKGVNRGGEKLSNIETRLQRAVPVHVEAHSEKFCRAFGDRLELMRGVYSNFKLTIAKNVQAALEKGIRKISLGITALSEVESLASKGGDPLEVHLPSSKLSKDECDRLLRMQKEGKQISLKASVDALQANSKRFVPSYRAFLFVDSNNTDGTNEPFRSNALDSKLLAYLNSTSSSEPFVIAIQGKLTENDIDYLRYVKSNPGFTDRIRFSGSKEIRELYSEFFDKPVAPIEPNKEKRSGLNLARTLGAPLGFFARLLTQKADANATRAIRAP